MTDPTNSGTVQSNLGLTDRAFVLLVGGACFILGVIALYSSGIDLIDPKLHRAGGFALALMVAVATSRHRRAERSAGPARDSQGNPRPGAYCTSSGGPFLAVIDIALVLGGLWAIWSFYSVQTLMEVSLYDVRQSDATPAFVGLVMFLEMCRRLWGWGLFTIGALGALYLLFGQNLPGILEHTGFDMVDVSEALWYNTN